MPTSLLFFVIIITSDVLWVSIPQSPDFSPHININMAGTDASNVFRVQRLYRLCIRSRKKWTSVNVFVDLIGYIE